VSNAIKIVNLEAKAWLDKVKKLSSFLKKSKDLKVISTVRSANIVYGLAVMILGWRKRHKVVFLEVNTFDSIRKKSFFKRKLWSFAIWIAYLKADVIGCSSVDVRLELLALVPTLRNAAVVFGNPVVPENFNELRKEEVINGHPWLERKDLKVFLHVGRLHFQKNQEFLIKGFFQYLKIHKNSRLLIIGEGEDLPDLLKLRSELNLDDSVDFMKFTENLYPIFCKSDVFVMTSRWEGFGNVFIMAMACGIPILTSNCAGGPKEIVTSDVLGKLYENGSLDDFVSQAGIVQAYRKDFSSVKFRHSASLKYSVKNIAEKYLESLS
jgi:glycosyltransferase involved in cell wall biosynthesis